MLASPYPWSIVHRIAHRPTVGLLMDLCEENYQRLIRLAPQLPVLHGGQASCVGDGLELLLNVVEQTPYTTLIRLSYHFGEGTGLDPDALIRIYHDAVQAEIVELRQRALPLNQGFERPTLEQKWRANLFLSKWLSYCIVQGHGFSSARPDSGLAPAGTPR